MHVPNHKKMTLSKHNFAIACFLLGMTGLLVSCGGEAAVKPTTVELTADKPEDCLRVTPDEDPKYRKPASSKPRVPIAPTVKTADCIIEGL